MSEEEIKVLVNKRKDKKKYSSETKKNIYEQWRLSGLSQKQFCKGYGIASSTFYKWHKHQNEQAETPKGSPSFLRVVATNQSALSPKVEMVGIKINLPNQAQLELELAFTQAIEFVRGLSDATAIIR